ncbi:polysaccharide biosynthesis tyrosine autokinase [Corynebacterium neomassiliense]|uniref:polysaccharide biosynthesis tyrosine autokinase n=1 Tax=Corynebacterium neomassiliense TaxID=2079482 RepID=UPI0010301D6B|nr:polysaccharide biosynthesis tyrosine autokinase [Corynebacterium neomassiliense]
MTARTDSSHTRGPASSPLVLGVCLGAVALAVGLLVRPRLTGLFGGFGNDAATIRWIMSSPFDAADLGAGSYSAIAAFYTRIGMVEAPTAAAVLGVVIGAAVLGAVLVRVDSVHLSTLALVLALVTPLAVGVYQAAYTKEVVISLAMLVIVLMPVNLLGEILVVASMALLGAEFRTYWFIVMGLYVVFRVLLSRRPAGPGTRSTAQVVWMIVGVAVVTGLAVWTVMGVPADSFRTDANDTAERQANTGSLITRFVNAPEPLGGILNSTLTSLFFIVPLPMLAKFSPYYLVIGVLFALIWTSAVRAAGTAGRGNPLLARFTALPLAFLVVQGLFEPDWGSALRHTTPILPLIVGAVALASRQAAQDTVPDPGDDPPGETGTGHPIHCPPSSRRLRTTMISRTSPASTASSAGGTFSARNVLVDYLGHLRRSWWMLVVGALVGALAGWGATALMTKEYTATAQVYVGTASTGGSSDAYQGVLLSQKQVGSYAEVANGRALSQRVVDQLGLDRTPDEVMAMLDAGAHKDTVILDLTAVSGDPVLSRDVANSAATQLQQMVRELNEQTSAPGAGGAPQLALLNQAVTPTSPSSPNMSLNIALGLVVGLVVGAVAAVCRGLFDRRITDPAAIQEIVDAPVIGSVGTADVLVEHHTLDFSGAPTPAAEQLRELRTNLRFLDVDNAPTVLAVTSAMPGDGKSTLAVNLALALADDGESVCLVDADLRDPSVTNYVGNNLQSAVGLSTALSGRADIGDVIQSTATEGLSVVASGPIPPNPAELLGSRRFGEILAQLAARFDHVILDASPVLPVPDGALVASPADGVLITVRYNGPTPDQLPAAADTLTAVNSRILGTVFTQTPAPKGRYGRDNGHGAHGYGATAATAGTAATPDLPDAATDGPETGPESGPESGEDAGRTASTGTQDSVSVEVPGGTSRPDPDR